MHRSLFSTVLAANVALVATSAFAAPITVINPSFESQVLPDYPAPGSFVIPVTNWVGTGANEGVWNPSVSAYTGAAGAGTPSGADETNTVYTYGGGFLYQILSHNLAVGTYTVTVAVGNRADATMSGNWHIAFRANGVATDLVINNGASETLIPQGTFQDVTFNYVATDSNPLLGTPVSVVLFAAGSADYDNVRVNFDPIPEPGSAALALLGVALTLPRRRPARA